jgi:hypothetical protein
MPVEGFEPSTPHGDLFLRQARIPFRHAGSCSAFHARSLTYPFPVLYKTTKETSALTTEQSAYDSILSHYVNSQGRDSFYTK